MIRRQPPLRQVLASLILCLGLAAHCVHASDLRREGVRSDYSLDLAPRQAARCLARNAELRNASFRAQIRETETLITEVWVQRGADVLALAHVAPWKGGAVATIWRAPSESQGLTNSMANGC